MQYMLIFNENSNELAKRENPAQAQAYWGAWNEYVTAINASGIVRGGNGLQAPHTATRVQMKDGKRHVQDGPSPDAREHLGGYFVIDVDNLDVALEWASKSPNAANGYTEIRPVMLMNK